MECARQTSEARGIGYLWKPCHPHKPFVRVASGSTSARRDAVTSYEASTTPDDHHQFGRLPFGRCKEPSLRSEDSVKLRCFGVGSIHPSRPENLALFYTGACPLDRLEDGRAVIVKNDDSRERPGELGIP